MHKIKSHKSVEQIAKKHRIDVSFVEKQLKMGIPIEHEHTGDKDLATDIALQHLDEIPDYYTRLKKMEANAKKSHDKKYKDVTEGKKLGLWDRIHARRKKGLPRKKPGQKGYPETLDIKEDLKQARKNVGASKCWTGKKVGNPSTKMKDGKEVPNCVSKEEVEFNDIPILIANGIRYCPSCKREESAEQCKYGKKHWTIFSVPSKLKDGVYDANAPHPGNFPENFNIKNFSEFMMEASAAWQRKEGKNPTGGLNAKGRASAKAQGHNLKPPVTTPPSELDPDSNAAKRRESFCARMGGMPGPMKDEKGRPTRKALSLKKWNC